MSTKGDYFPKLLYHTAISLDKIGDPKTANGFYKALKTNYPNSPEAKASPIENNIKEKNGYRKNSVVSMFYELKDANTNEVLESNLYAQPISFILGKGQFRSFRRRSDEA